MKPILLFSALLITAFSQAQVTTATDFNVNDCAGSNHHLFADLDAGKVVVISFVMPCSMCIGPSLTAYNIVQSYATSQPGRVEFFVSDDQGNTPCSTLSGWCTNNNIGPNLSCFVDPAVNEADYGSIAMPKIVVLGGANHHVYFLADDAAAGNSANLQNAIDAALIANGISTPTNQVSVLSNDNGNSISVTLNNKATSFELINNVGAVSMKQTISNSAFTIDVSQLANGIYFLKINTGGSFINQKIVVMHN